MKLCSVCDQFTLHDFSRLPDNTFSVKLTVLKAGWRASCSFCTFLCDRLQETNHPTFWTQSAKTWVRLRNQPQSVRQPDVGLQLYELELYLADTQFETKTEHRSDSSFLGLAADIGDPAARDGTIAGRYYGNEPGSDAYIEFIKDDWLKTCLKHQHCRRGLSGTSHFDAQKTTLPTRCIEVSDRRIFLRDTKDEQGSYITLSHRWTDQTKDCRTTVNNMRQRMNGQGFGTLPQIFVEAMALTQLLKVRYIWIDSLCIIQDGDEGVDWKNEARQMSRYYQSSLLTISFVGESPAQDVLDLRPSGPFQSLLRMPYKNNSGAHDGWYYVYRPHQRSLTTFISDVRNGELLRRGWILQEWFLSRRTIYCTPQELFFECQTDLPMNERRQKLLVEPKDDTAVRIRNKMQKLIDFDSWYDIVEMYSKTSLTKVDEDHLVAISGIATALRYQLNASPNSSAPVYRQYASGLWLEDLLHGLLWQTRSSTWPCICGAPSWSWASRMREPSRIGESRQITEPPQIGELRWLSRSSRTEPAARIRGLRDSRSQLHNEVDLRNWQRSESSAELSRADRTGAVDTTGGGDTTDTVVIAGTITAGHETTTGGDTTTRDDPFDTDSMTTGIMLEGRVALTLVRSPIRTNEETSLRSISSKTIETLARETDVTMTIPDDGSWEDNPDCVYAMKWLLVCAPSTPTVIGGWALLDDVQYEHQLHSCEGTALLALHISTRQRVGKTGQDIVTRRSTIGRDVYEVLFLEPQGGNTQGGSTQEENTRKWHRYRRVGVGRIFDSQIIANMVDSDLTKIELV